MAVIVQMSVSLVLFICVLVFVAACSSGVVLCCVRRADLGVPLIASGVIAFVVAGAQVEIDNNRNLQADRQSLELAFAQTRDLTSGDFRGRDLHQFYIAEKHLEYALFDGSDLARAAFRCDSLQVADFASPGDPSAVLT